MVAPRLSTRTTRATLSPPPLPSPQQPRRPRRREYTVGGLLHPRPCRHLPRSRTRDPAPISHPSSSLNASSSTPPTSIASSSPAFVSSLIYLVAMNALISNPPPYSLTLPEPPISGPDTDTYSPARRGAPSPHLQFVSTSTSSAHAQFPFSEYQHPTPLPPPAYG